jgi:hypothetical protein
VLASSAVITGMMALAYGAIGLLAVGIVFNGMALFAPHLPHDALHWVQHLFAATGVH